MAVSAARHLALHAEAQHLALVLGPQQNLQRLAVHDAGQVRRVRLRPAVLRRAHGLAQLPQHLREMVGLTFIGWLWNTRQRTASEHSFVAGTCVWHVGPSCADPRRTIDIAYMHQRLYYFTEASSARATLA